MKIGLHRRILRKVAANELYNLGDTTTLAEPAVVDDLIANRAAAAQ
jgi:acetyl-CoA synthetase